MERKKYSSRKSIPRQTLWSQNHPSSRRVQRKRRRNEDGDSSQTASKRGPARKDEGKNEEETLGDASQNIQEAIYLSDECNDIPLLPIRGESDSDYCSSSDEDDICGTPASDTLNASKTESDSEEEDEGLSRDAEEANIIESDSENSTLSTPSKQSGQEDEDGATGASVPEKKYSLLIHLLRTKHGLTKEATDDVLEILNELSTECLEKNILPKDARTIGKMYEPYLAPVEKHFICVTCGMYAGRERRGVDKYKCRFCESTHSFKDSEHFFYLPLAAQLRQLFEDNPDHILESIDKEYQSSAPHLISNVKDGVKYREYLKKIDKTVQNISATFSIDSVPVFDSSKSSLVPVTCTINELPLSVRKRHVLMPVVWYGVNKKPDTNQLLYPFVRETIELRDRGFTYFKKGEEQVCKVTILKNISDSVAKADLSNRHQYNGESGCSDCYHIGVQVPKGKGTVRVYPHADDVARRTSEETLQLAEEASTLQNKPFHVKGVKGKTIVQYIPEFDIVDGFIPDYMHAAVLGVMRQFAKLWFNSKYHTKTFYIGNQKAEINKRLSVLKPPFYVSRPPRSIEEMKFWKGHEWFIWGLCYSIVVLKGILPNVYLKHWLLFGEGLFLLLQESVSKSQVHNAVDLLVQFTKGTEQLYGVEHCCFNMHLCEHLGTCVLNWGPLWENSAFLFEDYYQVLLKSIHSSKGVLDQVVKQYRTMRSIPSLLATTVGASVKDMSVAKREKILSTQNSVVCSSENCDSLMLAPKLEKISDAARLAFASIDIRLSKDQTLLFSDRVIVNSEVFHSKSYAVVKRRNSFTVLLNDGTLFVVETYAAVGRSCFGVGRFLELCPTFKLFSDRDSLPFQRFVKKRGSDVCVVNVCKFISKVIFVKCNHFAAANLVCIPPNRNEVLK